MLCPSCNSNNDTVTDSRSSARGRRIRRRRECLTCGHRFTTMEINSADLPDMPMKDTMNKGERMEKEPTITMVVSRTGVSVDVKNGESLDDPSRAQCFAKLAQDVHAFAQFLVERAFRSHEKHLCD